MKKVIFTLLTIGLMYSGVQAQYCGGSGGSQCTPTGQMTEPGLAPLSDSLPSIINGEVSTTIIQFKNYDTARYQGTLVTINTLQIDSIGNLPAGLCWTTNKTNNTYSNQEDGCIRIIGTTCSNPGVYKLFIRVRVDIGLGIPVPVNAEEVGLKYYVRVINNGDSEVALDTSQAVPFTKPAGYSASAVCGVGISDLGRINNTLSVVPNPFSNNAVVTFFSTEVGEMTERITNLIGSEVLNRQKEVVAGENTSVLDRSNLSAGVYFYSLSDGKNIVTKRVVIE